MLPPNPTAPRPVTHFSPNLLELDLLHTSLMSLPPEVEAILWEFVNSLNLQADWRSKIEAFTASSSREWIRTEGVVQKMTAGLPLVRSFWVKASHRGVLHFRLETDLPVSTDEHSISQRLPVPHSEYLVPITRSAKYRKMRS